MVKLTVLAVLWAVTLLRARNARRFPATRPMWCTFAALALALTLELPMLAVHFDAAVHITNLSALVRHLFGVLAAASVLEWVIASAQPTRILSRALAWRHTVTGAAMAALGGLFAFVPRVENSDFIDSASNRPVAIGYEAVWLGYLGLAMLCAAAIFTVAWRRSAAEERLMRVSFAMLAIGTAINAVDTALRLGILVAPLAGAATTSQSEIGFGLSNLIRGVTLCLILSGTCIPALMRATSFYQDRRDLAALYPLWQLVTPFRPDTVLYPESESGTDGDGLKILGLLRFRLIRRTMEIRDSLAILYEYCDVDPAPYAEAFATSINLTGVDHEALVEATTIRYALLCAHTGKPKHNFVTPQRGADDDLRAEVRWLLAVTRALDNHMRVQMALIPILADRNELVGTP
ncbi:hypothetical protein GCM10009839_58330 [Catenulispora yoronensis]|uniref:DUF6545 domain-containing protein n=1 Tax=Catenulispora yoronensis TaxID=450799 RepID=A0ABN2V029_9ACTN